MDAAVPEEVSTPVLSLDFTFMGTSSVRAQANPYLVMYDNNTDATKVYRTRKKGVVRWVIDAILTDIRSLGYGNCKICIRHDRESSLLAIRDAIAQKRTAPIVPLDVPVRESKSNGNMERAIRTWQNSFRTVKEGLQEKLNREIPINSIIAEWISWWASELINRVRKNKFGRTAYQMVMGRDLARPLAPHSGKSWIGGLRPSSHLCPRRAKQSGEQACTLA